MGNSIPREKHLENRIKKHLKSVGAYFIKYWGGGHFTRSGVPDILACVNGKFIGIEVKSSKGVVSELQKHHLREIERAGGIAMVVRPENYSEFEEVIRETIQLQ